MVDIGDTQGRHVTPVGIADVKFASGCVAKGGGNIMLPPLATHSFAILYLARLAMMLSSYTSTICTRQSSHSQARYWVGLEQMCGGDCGLSYEKCPAGIARSGSGEHG